MILRKIISGPLILLTAIILIGCGKQITETEALVETTEEISTTEETIEETTEEVIEESEETTEETTEEVTEEPPEEEKYFTYKAKYEERYPQAVIITDESFAGDLRISLSDDLPETFFEGIDCKSSEECFNEVIKGVLDSLEGKEVILRDTQRGVPMFSVVDTKKTIEIVFKYIQTKEEETGPLHLPWPAELEILYSSYAFVQRQDGGLRLIAYQSPAALEDELNIPGGRYSISADLFWMAGILKFHPEMLGGQINPTKFSEFGDEGEEEKFYSKIHQFEWVEEEKEERYYLGILMLKGDN